MEMAMLQTPDGAPVPLQEVAVTGRLDGLLSEVTLVQRYENSESSPIEAVYTFPLPLDAVLLELTVDLGGERLTGRVVPAAQAEERYEEAMEEGDSAVLVTRTRAGLYTLNLGNLQPGETAEIRLRYGQLHRWNGAQLRFHLPTTLAPFYGNPLAAGLAPHQVPEQTLLPHFHFSLELVVEGALASAALSSPSHPLEIERQGDCTRVRLAGGQAAMDRDFVLVVERPPRLEVTGLVARDGDRLVALASFHPDIPATESPRPRCFELVVDCSGSMTGIPIKQAREALGEILRQLAPADRFNIVRFGSDREKLFPRAVPADRFHLEAAARLLEKLEADMGGTELERAVEAALEDKVPDGMATDLLLITDGEVWEHERLVQQLRASGRRLFAVGVSHAMNEPVLRALAEASGGACELVVPGEGMAERIVRHFQRIRQPDLGPVRMCWPSRPLHQTPARIGPVYAGDTLHLFGWFSDAPQGAARLELGEGERVHVEEVRFRTLDGRMAENLVRLAAHARMAELDDEAALDLALEYGLLGHQTSLLLVKAREEKSKELPRLRKVPHALAAGWGGLCFSFDSGAMASGANLSSRTTSFSMGSLDQLLESFERVTKAWEEPFLEALARFCLREPLVALPEITLDRLSWMGVPEWELAPLRARVKAGEEERLVVLEWLLAFLGSQERESVPRDLRRLVRRAARQAGILGRAEAPAEASA